MGAVRKIFNKPAAKAVANTVATGAATGAATKTAEAVETTKPRGESDSYAANMGRSQARRRKRGRGTVLASAMGTQDTLG